MKIEEKLYTERFVHSLVPYKTDEENIFIQYYFDSLWRGTYQTSSSTENPHSIFSLVTGGDVICTDPDGKVLHIPENTLYVITAAKKDYFYKVPKNSFWQRKSVRFRRNALFDLLANHFFQKDHLVIPLKNPEKIGMIMDEFKNIIIENEIGTELNIEVMSKEEKKIRTAKVIDIEDDFGEDDEDIKQALMGKLKKDTDNIAEIETL